MGFMDDLDIIDISLNIDSIEFNIFQITYKVGRNRVLTNVYYDILNKLVLNNTLMLDYYYKLDRFTSQIRDDYNKNVLFHNDLHAIHFCQTLFSWVTRSGVDTVLRHTKLDLLSLYTYALFHDIKHPGYTMLSK